MQFASVVLPFCQSQAYGLYHNVLSHIIKLVRYPCTSIILVFSHENKHTVPIFDQYRMHLGNDTRCARTHTHTCRRLCLYRTVINQSAHARLQVSLCVHRLRFLPLFGPKFDFYILTPVTSKSRLNRGWLCQLVHTCQMHRCKFG